MNRKGGLSAVRRKVGRPPKGERTMTATERSQARYNRMRDYENLYRYQQAELKKMHKKLETTGPQWLCDQIGDLIGV